MRSARRAAWEALVALEKGKIRRLDESLSRAQVAEADRPLVLELARGVERTRLLLDFVLAQLVAKKPPKDPHVLVALRLGIYQLTQLTRVPDYAAVDETVSLVRNKRERNFTNAVLRRLTKMIAGRPADVGLPRRELALPADRALVFERDCLPDPEKQHAAYHALLAGLPEFVVQRWEKHFCAETAARIAAASVRTPRTTLRANRLRGDAAALAALLAEQGVETEKLEHPQLLRWTGGRSPFGSEAFADGWFVAQDPTSVATAEALGVQPGETVVDLCAGPGTKTTLLAELVGPEGHVHAYDVSEARRAPIRENAERLGLQGVITVHDDVAQLPMADRVLADVPCSNTGVLARRVEVRRRLTPEVFSELAEVQKQLLQQAMSLCRPGGRVAYSTCSIEVEENDEVVAKVAGRDEASSIGPQWGMLPNAEQDGGFLSMVEMELLAPDS